jgi:ABC-type glycerol-3-phosphate transport system permease component
MKQEWYDLNNQSKVEGEDTGMAIMSTMMIALVSIVPMLFIFSALGIFEYVHESWLGVAVLVFANYFRIVLREQYKKFAQERREFLDGFRGE